MITIPIPLWNLLCLGTIVLFNMVAYFAFQMGMQYAQRQSNKEEDPS